MLHERVSSFAILCPNLSLLCVAPFVQKGGRTGEHYGEGGRRGELFRLFKERKSARRKNKIGIKATAKEAIKLSFWRHLLSSFRPRFLAGGNQDGLFSEISLFAVFEAVSSISFFVLIGLTTVFTL